MKKRLLSIALCLCMVLSLLPTAALAVEDVLPDRGLLDFRQVGTGDGQTPAQGDGYQWTDTSTADRKSATLTLTNFKANFTVPYGILFAVNVHVTLVLVGDNQINTPLTAITTASPLDDPADTTTGSLTITGDGTLRLKTASNDLSPLLQNHTLCIDGAKVEVVGNGVNSVNFTMKNGADLSISASNARANGNLLYVKSSIDVADSTLTIDAPQWSVGMYCVDADSTISISNSTLSVRPQNIAIYGTGSVSVTNSNVVAVGASAGIYSLAKNKTLSGNIFEYGGATGGTVCGNVTLTKDITLTAKPLTVQDGATLTVPKGITLDASADAGSLTVENNGSTVVNGTLALGAESNVELAKITGTGTVKIDDDAYGKLTDGTWAQDITATGLNLTDGLPNVVTTYKAGAGTIVYDPAAAKLTLNNATVHGALYLTTLDSPTIEVNGVNTVIPTEEQREQNAIYAYDRLTLTGSGSLTASAKYSGECWSGIHVEADSEDATIAEFNTEDFTGTLNALVNLEHSGDSRNYEVYGSVTLDGGLLIGNGYTLHVNENATLTIAASGELVIFKTGTLEAPTFTNDGKILNNGVIALDDTTSEVTDVPAYIQKLKLDGSGIVDYSNNGPDNVAYTNAGKLLHTSRELDFTETDQQDEGDLTEDGYHWDQDNNTLTIHDLVVRPYGSSYGITLPYDATLIVKGINDITGGISAEDDGSGSVDDGEFTTYPPRKLTIQGDGILNTNGSLDATQITVTGDVTVHAGWIVMESVEEPYLTVSGSADFTVDSTMMPGTLTVEDSAVVKLAGDYMPHIVGRIVVNGGQLSAKGSKMALIMAGDLILGADCAILTPAGGKVLSAKTTMLGDDGTIYSVVPAGVTELAFPMEVNSPDSIVTNAATEVVIGKKAAAPSGSNNGSSTTTTTEKNPDGSTTTTVTNKATGTVTETTKKPDGSAVIVETKKDGSATTTDKAANGVTTVTKTDKNGAAIETTVTVPAAVKEPVKVTVPTELGKTDGTVSAEITYQGGTKETVTGSYSGGKVSLTVTGSATIEILDDFVPLAALPFLDVDPSAYYRDAVQWAVANGVTGGTSADAFSPDMACTRAQTVTFLWRAMGSPEPAITVNPFADVSADAYYYKAVLWAVGQGVTAGTSAAAFSPDATVTRGQTVTFLWRAAGMPAVDYAMDFADVAQDAYYAEAVRWAASEGVTSGTGAGVFAPEQACTRAQIVTFLYRWLNK